MKTMTWLKIKFAVGVGVAALLTGGVATVALSDGANGSRLTSASTATDSQQVTIITTVVRVPTDKAADVLATIDQLHGQITPNSAAFSAWLKKNPSVEHIGSPTIVTGPDQEAVVSVTKPVSLGKTNAHIGLTVRATPHLKAGSKVTLELSTEFSEVDGDVLKTYKQDSHGVTFDSGMTVLRQGMVVGGNSTLLVLVRAGVFRERLQAIINRGGNMQAAVENGSLVLPGRHLSEQQAVEIAARELPTTMALRCEFKDGIWEISEIKQNVWGVSSATTNANGKVIITSTNVTHVVLRVHDADGKVDRIAKP